MKKLDVGKQKKVRRKKQFHATKQRKRHLHAIKSIVTPDDKSNGSIDHLLLVWVAAVVAEEPAVLPTEKSPRPLGSKWGAVAAAAAAGADVRH